MMYWKYFISAYAIFSYAHILIFPFPCNNIHKMKVVLRLMHIQSDISAKSTALLSREK